MLGIFFFSNSYCTWRYEAEALASNQQLAINLGVFLDVCIAMYATAIVILAIADLTYVGNGFQNLLPVLMGFPLTKFGNYFIGNLMEAWAVGIIKQGLNIISMGSALNIVLGMFMIAFSIYTCFDERVQRKALAEENN